MGSSTLPVDKLWILRMFFSIQRHTMMGLFRKPVYHEEIGNDTFIRTKVARSILTHLRFCDLWS